MELEAEVPLGVQPGQTFMIQTANGLFPVKVPDDHQPGQRLHVTAPAPVAPGQPPVLLGRAAAGPGFVPSRAGQPARAYRVDPLRARADELPLLQGIPVQKAERKLGEIHQGGQLAHDRPAFPAARQCRDAAWVVPFVLVVALVIGAAAFFSRDVTRRFEAKAGKPPLLGGMVAAGVAGGAASLLAAGGFVVLANVAPGCVVWTSLLFSPVLMILFGLAVIAVGQLAMGVLCFAIGALSLSCVLCCFRPLIPFTITVVKMVARVMKERPAMVAVSVFGSLVGLAWSIICGLAFVGCYLKYQYANEEEVEGTSRGQQYAWYFVEIVILLWGAQVIFNVCHVTNCGVFGRWYFASDERAPVCKSLRVAMGTSFGSICLGSLLVAAIRALEAVVRQARVDAQQDGNPLCCVLLMVLECIVSCIGDILEYFSEWAYVQCAVRGVSFFEAARITYSMMTCANLFFVVQDLLINSVVNLGALFCGIVGCAVGAGTGFALGAHIHAISGAVIGLWAGLLAGGSAAGIISSGTKTLLVLWAEDPEPLRLSRPEIHHELENRILVKLDS